MNNETQPTERRRPTARGAVFAAIYGALAATIAYLISRGNVFWMLVVMIGIGVAFRLRAYVLIRRRGAARPPWWKWL